MRVPLFALLYVRGAACLSRGVRLFGTLAVGVSSRLKKSKSGKRGTPFHVTQLPPVAVQLRQVTGMPYSEETPYTGMEYEAQHAGDGVVDTFECLQHCHSAWQLEGLQDLLEQLCNPRYSSWSLMRAPDPRRHTMPIHLTFPNLVAAPPPFLRLVLRPRHPWHSMNQKDLSSAAA
jgi:hypothetical protein